MPLVIWSGGVQDAEAGPPAVHVGGEAVGLGEACAAGEGPPQAARIGMAVTAVTTSNQRRLPFTG